MPRLYFDLHNGTGFTRDEEGRDLADEDQERAVAIQAIREIISEEVLKGVIDLTGRIDIRSDTGVIIGRISFREAVSLRFDKGDPDDRASSGPD